MPAKMLRINCVCYWNGQCLHQAAPRRFFGPSDCLLVKIQTDPRVPEGCSLQVPNEKPSPPPNPPGGE